MALGVVVVDFNTGVLVVEVLFFHSLKILSKDFVVVVLEVAVVVQGHSVRTFWLRKQPNKS